DYTTLLGASAVAFRVRWFQGKEDNRWCPSSPIGEGTAEMEAIRKATGWGLSTEDASGEDEAKAAKLHDQIVAALETGTPVLAYDSGLNIMVVFGYEKGSSDLLAHAYGGGAEPSRWPVSKLPMMLIFLKKDGPGLSPDAVCREGLRLAVRNWQRGLMPAGAIGYWYGSSALEHWRADLAVADSYTDKEREQLFFVSWWNYDSLADARQAAVTYLEQSLPVLKGESRAAAAQALKIYQDEVSLLASAFKDGNAFFGPWSGKTVADWNEATRKREQEILTTACALEQQAMEYLAKAVL
ncbi:MAG TPA: hypothetical protein VHR86_04505, partial [Armatimonadota bacterium]|nr:hypothetical protein [Armatimonadota bacterium]